MATITAKQLAAICRLFTDGDDPIDSVDAQTLIDGGFLADLRDADFYGVDRDKLRQFLGLPPRDVSQFPAFMTVKLDPTLKTAYEFRAALKAASCNVGRGGDDFLDKSEFVASPEPLELVKLSVCDLGFKKAAKRKNIVRRALGLGLELCPNEVGPQLRLQYKDQPKGELLVVATTVSLDCLLTHDNEGLLFAGITSDPGRTWFPLEKFVFVRRKSA